jgi:uncharacterized protein (DUF1810 family)
MSSYAKWPLWRWVQIAAHSHIRRQAGITQSIRITRRRLLVVRGGYTSAVTSEDPFDLDRFVTAQDEGGVYDAALGELRRGRKTSHWMWFVFPQIAGLGRSATARRFAVSSLDEARAYLLHPVLGRRLVECTEVVSELRGKTAEEIFGGIDAQKLHSSMTLFLRARPEEPLFAKALDQFFEGLPDSATDARL